MDNKVKQALKHPNTPGAGAAARRRAGLNKKEYVEADMTEFKRGTLRSGSGQKVTNRKQAIAIGLSEGRRSGR